MPATAADPGCPLAYDFERGEWRPWPAVRAPVPRFRIGRGGRTLNAPELFGAFRRAGLVPHPFKSDDDPSLSACVALLAGATAGPKAAYAGPASGLQARELPEQLLRTAEESVIPDPSLGVNKGRYAPDDDSDAWLRYGSAATTVADIARIGGGVIRQMNGIDLTWNILLPATELPPPAELAELLVGDDYAAFQDFSWLVIACLLTGVRISATLFCWGGGGSLNSAETGTEKDDCEVYDPASPDARAPDGLTYGEVQRGKPSHQVKVIIPSVRGWDRWYWDPEELLAEPGGVALVDQAEVAYQRMALNVWVDGDTASTYMQVAARRKLHGVMAYAEAVGLYLARLDEALGHIGLSLDDVIEAVECGNEMDVFWLKESDEQAGGAHELARLHAALAATVRWHVPGVKVKAAELASWGGDHDVWEQRMTWLVTALRDELPEVVDFLNTLGEGWPVLGELVEFWGGVGSVLGEAILGALSGQLPTPTTLQNDPEAYAFYLAHPKASAFLADALRSGFAPSWASASASFSATDLVQEVGFHWFHFSATSHAEYDDCEVKADDCQLANDAQNFIDTVIVPLSSRGFSLGWSVSAMGYPAQIPDVRANEENVAELASPRYQAASLVRMSLLLRAQGAGSVLWHTHIASFARNYDSAESPDRCRPTDEVPLSWYLYASMGIREDVLNDASEWDTSDGVFLGAHAATPKPAWYAFRRLRWLLDRAMSVTLSYQADGLTVLRLGARPGTGFDSPYLRPLDLDRPTSYSTAFVFWLDYTAPASSARVLLGWDGMGWASFSLVPEVIADRASRLDRATAPVDDLGFGLPDAVAWAPEGVDDESGGSVGFQGLEIEAIDAGMVRALWVTVPRANDDRAFSTTTAGLAVLFVEGEVVGVSMG